MSVFFKMAGVSPETSAVEYLKAFQRSYGEIPKQVPSQMQLMPPEAAPMPAVQFPVADAQLVPAQLPKVESRIFVMGEQHGMFGALGLNGVAEDLDGFDHLLDDAYFMPLMVNGQLMAVGAPRSPENLMMLAGIMEELSRQQEPVRPSSVKIEEIEDEEPVPQPAIVEPVNLPDNRAIYAAAAAEIAGANQVMDGAMEGLRRALVPVPAPSFCDRLVYILCTPFRWIGAFFSAIGRCFGCSS